MLKFPVMSITKFLIYRLTVHLKIPFYKDQLPVNSWLWQPYFEIMYINYKINMQTAKNIPQNGILTGFCRYRCKWFTNWAVRLLKVGNTEFSILRLRARHSETEPKAKTTLKVVLLSLNPSSVTVNKSRGKNGGDFAPPFLSRGFLSRHARNRGHS